MTDLTNHTLSAIERLDPFQPNILEIILSTIGLRYETLALPLKVGTPRYMNGKEPLVKLIMFKIVKSLKLLINPE